MPAKRDLIESMPGAVNGSTLTRRAAGQCRQHSEHYRQGKGRRTRPEPGVGASGCRVVNRLIEQPKARDCSFGPTGEERGQGLRSLLFTSLFLAVVDAAVIEDFEFLSTTNNRSRPRRRRRGYIVRVLHDRETEFMFLRVFPDLLHRLALVRVDADEGDLAFPPNVREFGHPPVVGVGDRRQRSRRTSTAYLFPQERVERDVLPVVVFRLNAGASRLP